jgi:predicted RNA-binding protein YlqC (UPF0109 family)
MSVNTEVLDLIQDIVTTIVDEPDLVEIKEANLEGLTIYEVKTAAGDVGKVIGKRGNVAHALRTLLCAISGKHQHRYQLEIVEK